MGSRLGSVSEYECLKSKGRFDFRGREGFRLGVESGDFGLGFGGLRGLEIGENGGS